MLRRRLRLILRHFSALLRGLLRQDEQTYSLPR
ncbi:gp001 [Erwinia phage vB_Eam-MM7]|uniref:Gp001 n=1 Tax=Erwinia phage vB_Eam-MM7 TaxID=1051674 RepID=G0YPI3_9CAUD|nr:gp001 [Erwinia phage vB_Eam-MM7]AEJ81260.1 gp001 [Erwinia phage vB_Eam-MM7]